MDTKQIYDTTLSISTPGKKYGREIFPREAGNKPTRHNRFQPTVVNTIPIPAPNKAGKQFARFFLTLTLLLQLSLSLFSVCNQSLAPEEPPILTWKYKVGSPMVASPVVADGCIYVGAINGTFYAVGAEDSSLLWQFKTYGPIRSTACIDTVHVFILSGDGVLYCLDKKSGKMVWTFKTFTGYVGDRRYDFADYYSSSPVLQNNVLYFGCSDGRIYALNSTTGQYLWSYQTGDIVHTTPALSGEKLFAGSFDGHLYALNASTGALLWKFKSTGHRYFPRGEVTGNPVVSGESVFVGTRDFNFYAIDINGGYCRWLKQFPKGWALPVTPEGTTIYLGTSDDRQLLAIDPKTGEVRWTMNAGFNIFGGCALDGTTGYLGTLIGRVICFDTGTGTIRWSFYVDGYRENHLKYFKPDDSYRDDIGVIIKSGEDILKLYNDVGAVFSTPALWKNRVIVTGTDGNIYCLTPPKK